MRLRFNPWVRKTPWRKSNNPLQYFSWRIPWTEEPGGLQSMGSRRVRQGWASHTQCMKAKQFARHQTFDCAHHPCYRYRQNRRQEMLVLRLGSRYYKMGMSLNITERAFMPVTSTEFITLQRNACRNNTCSPWWDSYSEWLQLGFFFFFLLCCIEGVGHDWATELN